MALRSLGLISFLICSISFAGPSNSGKRTLFVAAYNVENLFDTKHDEGKKDEEFLPGGEARWTDAKLSLKIKQLAKVIRSMNNGRGPDVLGLEEVENINALNMLNAELSDLKYKALLIEGPDERGIDTALLTRLPVVSEPVTYRVDNETWQRPTRLIMKVELGYAKGKSFKLLTNHWPSRRATDEFRCQAATIAREVLKAELKANENVDVILMGDLNDEPENMSINDCLKTANAESTKASTFTDPIFFDPFYEQNLSKEDRGSYYYSYERSWSAFDHIIMTKGLFDSSGLTYVPNSFSRVKNQFNTSPNPVRIGKKVIPPGAPVPFTVIDSKPNGELEAIGASDHFPVKAEFILN